MDDFLVALGRGIFKCVIVARSRGGYVEKYIRVRVPSCEDPLLRGVRVKSGGGDLVVIYCSGNEEARCVLVSSVSVDEDGV